MFRRIKRGKDHTGMVLFQSESLKWPGFVEFDDANDKAITFKPGVKPTPPAPGSQRSASIASVAGTPPVYKVWDLHTYRELYSISDMRLDDLKVSPNVLLLIYQRESAHLPLRLIDIHTGKTITSFKHLLHRNKQIVFCELFGDKLLIKQESEKLQVIDVCVRVCALALTLGRFG